MKCMCEGCNKKITVMKFTCKCGKDFCIKHKDPETHMCTFDFRKIDDLDKMIEANKCVSEKIKSI